LYHCYFNLFFIGMFFYGYSEVITPEQRCFL